MGVMPRGALCALAGVLALACASRPRAYWFHAPLLSGVAGEVLAEPMEPEGSLSASDSLRAAVGERTQEAPLAFALRTVSGLGVSLPSSVREAPDGEALLVEARARGALTKDSAPTRGDLVLFENGSLVGVVISQRTNGAVEFVYARGGIVRRGFVHPSVPTTQRDQEGKILNTFVRPFLASDRRGQKYLAGELHYGYVHVASLV
jgi:hypothetical protein